MRGERKDILEYLTISKGKQLTQVKSSWQVNWKFKVNFGIGSVFTISSLPRNKMGNKPRNDLN